MMFFKVKLYAVDEWVLFRQKDLRKATLDMNGSVVLYVDGMEEPMRLDANVHGPGAPQDFFSGKWTEISVEESQ